MYHKDAQHKCSNAYAQRRNVGKANENVNEIAKRQRENFFKYQKTHIIVHFAEVQYSIAVIHTHNINKHNYLYTLLLPTYCNTVSSRIIISKINIIQHNYTYRQVYSQLIKVALPFMNIQKAAKHHSSGENLMAPTLPLSACCKLE